MVKDNANKKNDDDATLDVVNEAAAAASPKRDKKGKKDGKTTPKSPNVVTEKKADEQADERDDEGEVEDSGNDDKEKSQRVPKKKKRKDKKKKKADKADSSGSDTESEDDVPSIHELAKMAQIEKYATKGLEEKITSAGGTNLQKLATALNNASETAIWSDAAKLKSSTIFAAFPKLTENKVQWDLVKTWGAGEPDKIKTFGTMPYMRRMMRLFIVASIGDNWAKSLQSAIDQSTHPAAAKKHDGLLLWYTLCAQTHPIMHVHIDNVKSEIEGMTKKTEGSWTDYVTNVQDKFSELNDAGENYREGLRTVMSQLSEIKDTRFQREFGKLEERYDKGDKTLMPFEVLSTAQSELTIIKAKNRKTDGEDNSDIMAMKATMNAQAELIKEMTALQAETSGETRKLARQTGKTFSKRRQKRYDDPPFLNDEPSDKSTVKQFDNKPWTWCTICGKWTLHGTKGHTNDYGAKKKARRNGTTPGKSTTNKWASLNNRAANLAAKSADTATKCKKHMALTMVRKEKE